MVAGQCQDLTHERAPNGLQLQLVDLTGDADVGKGRVRSETLVMQNYGYFQLQASPGVHAVALAPGRASDLYEIRARPDEAAPLLVERALRERAANLTAES